MRLPKDPCPFVLPLSPQQGDDTAIRSGVICCFREQDSACMSFPDQSEISSCNCSRNTPTSSALDSVSCGSQGRIKAHFLEVTFPNI